MFCIMGIENVKAGPDPNHFKPSKGIGCWITILMLIILSVKSMSNPFLVIPSPVSNRAFGGLAAMKRGKER